MAVLLAGVTASQQYERGVQTAKQAVLAEDLRTIRMAVNAFTNDNERAPRNLDEVVQAGYLKMAPITPVDGRRLNSW